LAFLETAYAKPWPKLARCVRLSSNICVASTAKRVPGRRAAERSVLRAATDELGITTPKQERPRRRHKGPIRVAVYKAGKR
jgi:hypothetical protein